MHEGGEQTQNGEDMELRYQKHLGRMHEEPVTEFMSYSLTEASVWVTRSSTQR